jgi:hypothetical protein
MIAQWISTSALGVYPPMSHWVYALTFLRSTSQGVEADSCSFTGSLPLWCVSFGFSGASVVVAVHKNKRDYRVVELRK